MILIGVPEKSTAFLRAGITRVKSGNSTSIFLALKCLFFSSKISLVLNILSLLKMYFNIKKRKGKKIP